MNRSPTLRRLLLVPPNLRSVYMFSQARNFHSALPHYYASPSVIQTSFWTNLIPKPLRGASPTAALKKTAKSREWNPATFFIAIFLLIGSMSIQMIALRNEFAAFSRRAEAKISLLKEIIGRIQNGEEVDVEGLLGTGDKEREKEWEEVLREIEEEDVAWKESEQNKRKQRPYLETENPPPKSTTSPAEDVTASSKRKSNAPEGFY